MEGPESAWEGIGTLPSEAPEAEGGDPMAAMGGMDVMVMCNINMMYMLVCVFVCLFISEDFRIKIQYFIVLLSFSAFH